MGANLGAVAKLVGVLALRVVEIAKPAGRAAGEHMKAQRGMAGAAYSVS
tara:strand:+ start:595 stop:741 length:147 start_codon:yes stop_codon:yes gene_type:complete